MRNNKRLLIACEKGDLIEFEKSLQKKFLNKSADINTVDSNSNTPLIIAVKNGHFNIVKRILSEKVDIEKCDSSGNTPIFLAVSISNSDIIKLLIDNGANINAENKKGKVPIMFADTLTDFNYLISMGAEIDLKSQKGIEVLNEFIKRGKYDIAKFLVENGVDINKKGQNGKTAFVEAIENRQDDLAKFLLNNGAKFDSDYKIEQTPLLLQMIKEERLDFINLLLEHNINVNLEDDKSTTALYESLKKGYFDLAKKIIDKGADTTYHLQEKAFDDDDIESVRFLIENGANINDKNTDVDNSILIHYSIMGAKQLADLVLSHGANVNIKDSEGNTPLHHASGQGPKHRKQGALNGIASNPLLKDDKVFHYWGFEKNRIAMIDILIKHGANKEITNNAGETPLMVAKKNELIEVEHHLLSL